MMDDKQLTEEYLDGKVVFPGKIIRVEHWHVRLPNGETALREVACHPGAAGIVALDDDGNVILVRQHRRPLAQADRAGDDPRLLQRAHPPLLGDGAARWKDASG